MANEVALFRGGESQDVTSTIRGADFETTKKVVQAVVNATPLADHLGQTINLVHVVVQPQSTINEESGEVEDYRRIVLLDADGSAYAASSKGLENSVKTILGVLGDPNQWPMPVPVQAKQEGKRPRAYFTLILV